jgi:transposase
VSGWRQLGLAGMCAGLLVVTGVTKPARNTRSPGASLPCCAGVRMRRRGCRRARCYPSGQLQPWAATYLKLTVQIVKRPADLHTFLVQPRRWAVERTLAWITSYRPCARDYERLPAHHEAAVYWAMITLMTRRLTRQARD